MPGPLISIEGGLLPPDLLDRIAAGEADGQSAAAFGLSGSQRLIDEAQRAFSDARTVWNAFQVRLQHSSASPTQITRQNWGLPFFEILGFKSLRRQRGQIQVGGQRYVISHIAGEADDAPPVHIVASGQNLNSRNGRRSPHASVQEYLNHSDAVWGMVTNGEQLRLLRASERFTRPTYIEFDLRGMFEGNQYAGFALAYRLLHHSRFPTDGASVADSWLERYFRIGVEEGGRVRERLREGVEEALRILGQALLQSKALREKHEAGELDETNYYRQLLRLVYRLLFLMVAEERRLIFPEGADDAGKVAVYRRYYSISALRERCERYFADDDHHDLWLGLMETFRIFREEEAAATLGLSPLDSELFGDGACPDLERAICSNKALLGAMRHLSTFLEEPDGGGRRGRRSSQRAVPRRVNYAALDVEELGSVYEALLDLQPRIEASQHAGGVSTFSLVASSERKQTGSYYTPPELVQALIDSALEPVMEERLASAGTRTEREQALLGMRVLDPAAGSGHFLLAAARRIAIKLAQARSKDGGYSPDGYREALRDVIRHCLYAVDKNPLAVDLCKVALWIESHSPGLPLSFLDHHIKCGDSLVGVDDLDRLHAGVPDKAYETVRGDDKKAASAYRKRNAQERKGQLALDHNPGPATAWAEDFATFADLDERNPAEVQAKEGLYDQLREPGSHWWRYKTACDLWTYAFFAPLQHPADDDLPRVPTTNDVRDALEGSTKPAKLIGAAVEASEQLRFFHWPLEFPDVFERGGFDVVIGNTPWERIKLQEKEFFATRDAEIAGAPNKAARTRLIARLSERNPDLAREWEQAQRTAESTSLFVRRGGRFPLAGRGDVNTYAPFAELFRKFTHEQGRAGVITPSGIATDATTRELFADFVNSRSLVSLFDFENRAGVFPEVHKSTKFCLLTLTGSAGRAAAAEFAFFLQRTEQINERERRFILDPEDFALFNPNTRTAPTFRTGRDAAIARKFYKRAGVLWREARDGEDEQNPWGVRFQSMFHMANDSGLFRTREALIAEGVALEGNVFKRGEERWLPLYEGKLFHQYDHRFATFDGIDEQARQNGNARELSAAEKAEPASGTIPRYWVSEIEVVKKLESYDYGRMMTGPQGHRATGPQGHRATGPQGPSTNRSQALHSRNERTDRDCSLGSEQRAGRFRNTPVCWLTAFRDITNATNERTAICAFVPVTAMNNKAPLIRIDAAAWLQAFRVIQGADPENSATVLTYEEAEAVASALVLANLNSLPFDWTARQSVGGTNLSFFIVKQLPVLPPEAYLERVAAGPAYAELVAPRVLELTYTSYELEGFARDLGYEGPPWPWDEERRHRLKCELDAIYAHMYRLAREDLEWILDAPEPSASFPVLKRAEEREFGEYRTQRYVLEAYDQMAAGGLPDLEPPPAATRADETSEQAGQPAQKDR